MSGDERRFRPAKSSIPCLSAGTLFSITGRAACLSIVMVIWHHAGTRIDGLRITSLGFLGVDMFFVLSGFLIVTLLLRKRDRYGNVSLRKFYMRRTLRIFPVYYALLLLLTLAYLIAAPHADSRTTFFLLLPFYLTYTSNWIPHQAANLAITWSLATEEQFYAVWPTVEKFVRSRLIYVPLAAVIIISQLINFGLLDHFLFDIVGLSPELDILQTTFMAITLGVLAATIAAPAEDLCRTVSTARQLVCIIAHWGGAAAGVSVRPR